MKKILVILTLLLCMSILTIDSYGYPLSQDSDESLNENLNDTGLFAEQVQTELEGMLEPGKSIDTVRVNTLKDLYDAATFINQMLYSLNVMLLMENAHFEEQQTSSQSLKILRTYLGHIQSAMDNLREFWTAYPDVMDIPEESRGTVDAMRQLLSDVNRSLVSIQADLESL